MALVDLCTDFREQQPLSAERQSDSDTLAEQDPPCDQPAPWDAWEDYLDDLDSQVAQSGAVCAAALQQHTPTTTNDDFIPAMPTTAAAEPHRPKLGLRRPINACVARAVSKKERMQDNDAGQRARTAMIDEWRRLRQKGTWDTKVREWSTVAAEAKALNQEVHFGYLLGLCFEKGSELPENHRDRKMKGRVVYQGNRVVNQNWEAALFQDLGSSLATPEASSGL